MMAANSAAVRSSLGAELAIVLAHIASLGLLQLKNQGLYQV